MFPHAEFMQLEMPKLRDADQPQRVRAAFERTTVNHEQLRRALDGGRDGFHVAADAGQTTHLGDAQLIEAAGSAVGQFPRMRTARTGEHAW